VSLVGQPERATQNRVVELFRAELGYAHLGDWSERINSNIEERFLAAWLRSRGHTGMQITRAIHRLRADADGRTLYSNNQTVYHLLRYGVPVSTAAGELHETVELIDWEYPERNHFAIAEEVTLKGGLERRPDIVPYVNGIAVGIIELKNSRVLIRSWIWRSPSTGQCARRGRPDGVGWRHESE
jgi:type I restriction enzyme R subunit